ncbi:TerB family tellurite resistance protein [Nannocystaceae bacterium ST9]
MPVSPETQWVLVACGLIAHADGEIDGNEAERLMAMVDDKIPADDYADWLGWIGDRAKLEAIYAALPDPPADQHRNLLEEAWTMAMVDGTRNTDELVVLARLAERLGVEPMQLEFWREAWSAAEREFARHAAEAAAWSLAGEGSLYEDDHSPYLDLVERLPTSTEERERLRALAQQPAVEPGALARSLAALAKPKRIRLFKLVGPLVRDAAMADQALARFQQLAKDAGLMSVPIDELLG